MANDRMYVRCETCGAQKLLAKTFGEGWHCFWKSEPEEVCLSFDEWFNDHAHGRPNAPRFCIRYEVRDNA